MKRKKSSAERVGARSVPGSRLLLTRSQRQLHMLIRSAKRRQRRQDRSSTRPSSDELLPGLMDDVVHDQIIPRLPWHQRPVMAAVSKLWRGSMASLNTRSSTSSELYRRPRGIALLFNSGSKTSDDIFQNQSVFELFDCSSRTWHELPPLPAPQNPSIEECFCADGSLYAICNTDIYQLNLPAGSWKWEKLATKTRINAGVTIAFAEDGSLFLSGKLDDLFVLEKHELENRRAKSICVRMSGFTALAAQRDDIRSLLDGCVGLDLLSGAVAFLLRIKPLHIRESCAAPAFLGETSLFLVATRRCFVELHDYEAGVFLEEVNLQRKLRLVVAHAVVALACDEGGIYALLQEDRVSHARFSLWRGSGGSPRELGKLVWEKVECCPLKFGDHCNEVSLRILS